MSMFESTPKTDPDLDIDLVRMEAEMDPMAKRLTRRKTVSELSPESLIREEADVQLEYVRTLSLYLELQEATLKTVLPDFRRVSAVLPEGLALLVDEIAEEMMRISLHAGGGKAFLKTSLETMIRKNTFDQEMERVRASMEASKQRLRTLEERSQAQKQEESQNDLRRAVLAQHMSDEAKIEGILVGMKPMPTPKRGTTSKEEGHPASLPGEESQRGLFDRARDFFR